MVTLDLYLGVKNFKITPISSQAFFNHTLIVHLLYLHAKFESSYAFVYTTN